MQGTLISVIGLGRLWLGGYGAAWEAVAHPCQGNVVGVLEGVVADEAGRPHAVGRYGDDLQEEHSVGGCECGHAGSGPAARAGAEAEEAQA